jgi:hypothetical protein
VQLSSETPIEVSKAAAETFLTKSLFFIDSEPFPVRNRLLRMIVLQKKQLQSSI